MNRKKLLGIGCLLAAIAVGVTNVRAAGAKAASQTPLTETGQKVLERYADMLKGLQAEIAVRFPPTVPN
jgi:hypothetical protein